jgi:glutathione S-transferase
MAAALIEENDQVFKLHLNRYKYPERHPEYPKEHYRSEGESFLRRLEALLETRAFLAAHHPSMADVAVMPFIRQFAHVDRDWFAQAPYPRLQDWLQRFLDGELFVAIMAK